MKRKTMIKLMVQTMAQTERGGLSEMTDEGRMGFLLSKMEEAGMSPPDYAVPKHEDWIVKGTWEPEDE